MNCPVCKISLVMSDRNGVEIDYCPSCRGVWLDRGELDKIIERTRGHGESHTQERYQEERHDERHDDHRRYDDDDDHHHHGGRHDSHHNRKHKKENFLGDLFDF